MMRQIRLAIFLSLLFACAAAWARVPAESGKQPAQPSKVPSAAALLRQMATARPITYTGVQVFHSPVGEKMLTRKVKIYNQPPDRLRVESGDEFHNVMVMDGNRFWRTGTRTRYTWAPVRPASLTRNIDWRKLLDNYNVAVSEGASIASRSTYLVSIAGKSAGRPSLKIWLDRGKFFRLKVEKKDLTNKLVYSFAFEEISFPETLPAQLFQPPEDVEVKTVERRRQAPSAFKSINEAQDAIEFSPALPTALPRGFSLTNIRLIEYRRRPVKTLQIVYSDGLTSISLFERRPGAKRQPVSSPLPAQPGKRAAGSRGRRPPERRFETLNRNGIRLRVGFKGGFSIISRSLPDLEVTVIGEIAKEELVELAASMKVVKKPVTKTGK